LLPIRPMLVGGDDVVFVCEGRLGVYLAERYIQYFCNEMNRDRHPQGEKVAACAGIAIVKTKYPFFRAYSLAEALMRKAKEDSRSNKDSWLAFMVSSSGFSGELDEILEQQYSIGNIDFYGGPYRLNPGDNTIASLKHGVKHFQDHWPRNKVMELRDMMKRPQDAQDFFMESIKARALQLPENEKAIKSTNYGKYMDMIEMMAFYPPILL
jgi:hypothetical protein